MAGRIMNNYDDVYDNQQIKISRIIESNFFNFLDK
jgi:hypothetical protein